MSYLTHHFFLKDGKLIWTDREESRDKLIKDPEYDFMGTIDGVWTKGPKITPYDNQSGYEGTKVEV